MQPTHTKAATAIITWAQYDQTGAAELAFVGALADVLTLLVSRLLRVLLRHRLCFARNNVHTKQDIHTSIHHTKYSLFNRVQFYMNLETRIRLNGVRVDEI